MNPDVPIPWAKFEPVDLGPPPIFYSYIAQYGDDYGQRFFFYRCDTCGVAIIETTTSYGVSDASRTLHTEWHRR